MTLGKSLHLCQKGYQQLLPLGAAAKSRGGGQGTEDLVVASPSLPQVHPDDAVSPRTPAGLSSVNYSFMRPWHSCCPAPPRSARPSWSSALLSAGRICPLALPFSTPLRHGLHPGFSARDSHCTRALDAHQTRSSPTPGSASAETSI